ncbi:MAG: hypothetical protein GQ547_01915 [Methylophaga sp.]|nr:hypothetical protein [Methylophaga sp.]
MLAVLVITLSPTLIAIPMPPVPLEPIYFEPPVVQPTEDIRNSSCVDLDNAIRYLQPYRYSYKPEFYQDGFNKVATAAITLDNVLALNGILGFAYLGYSALVEEKEGRRILEVEQEVTMLQQLKAEKHCFE